MRSKLLRTKNTQNNKNNIWIWIKYINIYIYKQYKNMNQHDIWQQPAFHQTGSTRYMSLVSSFYPLRSQPSSLNVQNRRIRRTSETQPCHWLGFQKKNSPTGTEFTWYFPETNCFDCLCLQKMEVDFSSISIVSEFATLDLRTRNCQEPPKKYVR